MILSGWQDSNLRPPRPKRGAITGLRYTPILGYLIDNFKKFAERMGLEPMRHLRVDRLAICSVTTPAPLLKFILMNLARKRLQMYIFTILQSNYLLFFFTRNVALLKSTILDTQLVNDRCWLIFVSALS